MAADCLISLAAKQQHLPHRIGQQRHAQAIRQPQRGETQRRPTEKLHQQTLAPGAHVLVWKTGQQVGLLAGQGAGQHAQRVGMVLRIGIGKQ